MPSTLTLTHDSHGRLVGHTPPSASPHSMPDFDRPFDAGRITWDEHDVPTITR